MLRRGDTPNYEPEKLAPQLVGRHTVDNLRGKHYSLSLRGYALHSHLVWRFSRESKRIGRPVLLGCEFAA